jgi:hypothetical protein
MTTKKEKIHPLLKIAIWVGGALLFGWALKSIFPRLRVGKIRNVLYGTSRWLGDANAVKRGTVGKRIVRRAAGYATGRILGKVLPR